MNETVRLKFLCSRGPLYGANESAESYRNEGVRFLRTTDIADSGDLVAGGVFIDEGRAKDYLLDTGDILLSRSGTLGRCFVFDAAKHVACAYAGYLVRFVPTSELNPRFFFYLTKSTAFFQWLDTETISSTIGNVNGQKFANMPLPAISRSSQDAVVDFLDVETAKIDALIERRRHLHELLDESVDALLSTLIENAGATRLPLRRVVSRFIDYRGQTPTKTTTGVRLVTARNIKSGRIDYSDSEEFIAESDYSDWMVRGLPAVGDLLITTEAPLGEVALIDEPSVALAQRIILIKPNTLRVSADYLWCYFRSVLGRSELEKRATGSTAVGIKASHLRAVPVVVPSPEVQRQIVNSYRAREHEARRIRRALVKATDLLREQRSALITAAVTGQIDVREHGSRLHSP